jgi:hypothetical protein
MFTDFLHPDEDPSRLPVTERKRKPKGDDDHDASDDDDDNVDEALLMNLPGYVVLCM